MKRVLIILCAFLFLMNSGCRKKKYPEPLIHSNAVYSASMDIDLRPVKISAGIDDYFLETSVQKDSSGLNVFTAEFKKTGCSSACPLSLMIELNDYKIQSGVQANNPDSTFMRKRYEYLNKNESPRVGVRFESRSNKPTLLSEYRWSFGNGNEANGNMPIHYFPSAGKYQVCLSAKTTGNCYSSNCSRLNVGPDAFRASVSSSYIGTDSIKFSVNTNKPGNHQYFWDFGDGSTSTLMSPAHNYNIQGAYQVNLRIINAELDSVNITYNVVTKNDLSSCAVNFSITESWIELPVFFSKVNIRWVDETGKIFNSSASAQPASSNFEIISVNDGSPDESGRATKKLRVRFNCRLFSGSTYLDVQNAEAIIALPYLK